MNGWFFFIHGILQKQNWYDHYFHLFFTCTGFQQAKSVPLRELKFSRVSLRQDLKPQKGEKQFPVRAVDYEIRFEEY